MAQILDSKQEVISVELTKYGRKLLGQGIFSPAYYFFFDDSVIYDDKYTGNNSETVNSIQDKILNDSINTRFLNLIDEKEQISDNLMPLGTSDSSTDYAPAWDLQILNGAIDEVSSSSTYFKKQLVMKDMEYQAELQNNNFVELGSKNNSTFELEDGRIIVLNEDYILLELKEENTTDDFKNFEIEIYTYEELYGGKEKGLKRKLVFTEKMSNIIDGIIYDLDEIPQIYSSEKIDSTDVGFYLDVLVDDEIDQNIITAKEQTIKDQIKPTYKENVIDVPERNC